MDTIGLIPGLGSGAKWAKITKNLNKYAIKPLTIAATAYQGIEEAQPFVQAVEKWRDANYNIQALSMDDIQHIASGLAVLSGAATWGKEVKTRRTYNKYSKSGTPSKVYELTTTDGNKVTLTQEKHDQLRRASSTASEVDALAAQNALLDSWFPGKKIATPFREYTVLGVKKHTGPKVTETIQYEGTPQIQDINADIPWIYGMEHTAVNGEVKPKVGSNAWFWGKIGNIGATPSVSKNRVADRAKAQREARATPSQTPAQ